MVRLPITVCMMVRDEEQRLSRCLSSLARLVSELVVVDTGSTDGTADILHHFGAQVIDAQWQSDFAKARNLGLAYARQPWILVIDADEELIPPDLDYILSLLNCQDVYGYFVKIRSHLGNAEGDPYVTDSACRLFRNHPNIRFEGAIHESVIPNIQALGGQIEFSEITLQHYGYLPEVITAKNKNARNLQILKNAMQDNPEDILLQYALATEYFQREQYEESLQILYPLLSKVPVSVGFASDIVLKTAYVLQSLGRVEEAMQIFAAGRQHFADFPDLLDMEANLMIQRGDYVSAKQLLEQSTQLGDMSHKYSSLSGAGTYNSCFLMGITQELLGNFEDAVKIYQRGIEHFPNYTPLWKRATLLTLGLGRDELLRSCLQCYGNMLTDHVWKIVFRALVDHRCPDMTREVMTYYPTAFHDPLLNAVLCAQEEDFEGAQKKMSQLLDDPQLSATAAAYLWALEVRHLQNEGGIDALIDTLDVEAKAPSDYRPSMQGGILAADWYCTLQSSLLHVNALDAWLAFQQRFVPASGPWLPLHLPLTLIDFPHRIREKLLILAQTRSVHLGRVEYDLLGLLCLQSNQPRKALTWFRPMQPGAAPNLAMTTVKYASYVLQAHEHLVQYQMPKLHLNVRGLLIHLLSYV
ncbi:glycosyltransferase [Alicyclobacillus tolerans]|uniref:glycosyltransferase n=1 Tax=Alicyclobacillus tolerans TaxID=90970 RepID=UPI001F41FA03|nr:glycosyltransferase [Alicyclobacillus tolerans]MCF8567609.1 glycosyltransferase [Alicyclobacillus tolerans]